VFEVIQSHADRNKAPGGISRAGRWPSSLNFGRTALECKTAIRHSAPAMKALIFSLPCFTTTSRASRGKLWVQKTISRSLRTNP